ncbi:MAG: adenylate/guanylate cyclase domain-containing protein [bacterium]|nr:adenylate/guanylate cyclase domain-containing protein [bacterium]
MTEKKIDAPVKIRFPIRIQIIWFVVALILVVVIVVYRTTLSDEKKELLRQMQLRGGALSMNLANNAQVVLSSAVGDILSARGAKKITQDIYERIDFFELGLSESVLKMLDQEDVIYAYILNPFNQIVAHSDKKVETLSEIKLPPGVRLFKDLYKNGDLVKASMQKYNMEYKSKVSGEMIEGEVIDIAFPLKVAQETKSLKTYEGEVHIGMSQEGVLNTIQEAKGKLLNVAFFSVFVGIGGAFLLALFLSNPLKKLVGAMEKVATGDLNQNVKIKRADEIGLLGWSFNYMTGGLREKEKIKNTFNKFVSSEVAEEVLKGDSLKLGGEYKEVTMFFSDIRNFTSMSEKMDAHQVVSMLNEYITVMTDVILKYKGVIDKYVGDEIMAVWGAPIKRDNDPELCVRAAIEQLKVLEELNKKRIARNEMEIKIGIGVNTGTVISGNIGSEKRLDYTVIGDNVNLASRLCTSAGKQGLHNFIIAHSTYEKMKDILDAKEVEPIFVKGKEKPIRIYEVYDIKDEYREFKV